MMEYIKKKYFVHECTFNHFLLGMWKYERRTKKANTNKNRFKKKSKKKLLRKRWICILLKNLEDFYNKRDIEMENLKKMIKVLG